MLSFGDEDLVSFLEKFEAITIRDRVERSGRSGGENHLTGFAIQESGYGFSRVENRLVHRVAKIIIPTVGVAGLLGVIIHNG